jgi:hypothetical protein
MTKNWNETPERAEEGLAFMKELNELLRKHKVSLESVNGSILTVRYDQKGCGDYLGFCGPQTPGKWTISSPWGG